MDGALYRVAQKVIAGVYQGVTTIELDVCMLYFAYRSHYLTSRAEPRV